VTETPAPRSAFEQSMLARRAWMVVIATGLGLSALILGVLSLVMISRHQFGARPPLRLTVGALAFCVAMLAIAYTLFRGGYIAEGGRWVDQESVPKRMIAIYGGLSALVIAAVAAWPLGLYDRAPDVSRCRAVLTADALPPVLHRSPEATYSGNAASCRVRFTADGHDVAAASVETGAFTGDPESVKRDGGWTKIRVTRSDLAVEIWLARKQFDETAVAQLVPALRAHALP
jgi:hypothetical protein